METTLYAERPGRVAEVLTTGVLVVVLATGSGWLALAQAVVLAVRDYDAGL